MLPTVGDVCCSPRTMRGCNTNPSGNDGAHDWAKVPGNPVWNTLRVP